MAGPRLLIGWRCFSTEKCEVILHPQIWLSDASTLRAFPTASTVGYASHQCKLQFSVAALAVLQQSAAAAVAQQHTVFHSSTLLGCWAEVISFISPPHIYTSALEGLWLYICGKTLVICWLLFICCYYWSKSFVCPLCLEKKSKCNVLF